MDFVGAGPGDPDWITVDGRRRIATADVLIVDALVHPAILADARWDARVHDVGKRAGRPSPTQDEICRLIVAEASGMLLPRCSECVWCPGPDSNRHGVASEGFSYQLQLSLLRTNQR